LVKFAAPGGFLLYWLLYQKLFPYFRPFRIFRYLTFRTAFATLTALLIALFVGPYVIQKLREFQIGQYIREEGPKEHQKKAGTPTMGGVLICIAILLPTLLWSDLSNPFVWLVMGSTVAFGAIGFADDYIKVVHRRNLGLTARAKLGYQALASAAIAVVLVAMQSLGIYSTQLTVPFLKNFHPHLSLGPLTHIPHISLLAFLPFVVFIVLVIVFSSNAVNLTDGLDGLASGSATFCFACLAVIGYWQFRHYHLYHVSAALDLALASVALAGACLGFLWWNAAPARIFMGDTGSLAIGAGLAALCLQMNLQLLLPVIGGLFVIVTLSVVIQVVSFRVFGRRVFRMAPLHHHFELVGWPETTVIVRFWIAAGLFAALGLGVFYADFLSASGLH
jgi:phospho-N-acetylmuramoyl-pentapeptide-transferase